MKQDPARFDANFAQAYRDFKRKINTFARNSSYAIAGFDVEDVEQELCIVLARCVRDYDPDRGASFNTLVQGSFKMRIADLIRYVNTQKRKVDLVYLDDDEVSTGIERMLGTWSAEDEVLAEMMVAEMDPERVRAALTLTKPEARRLRLVA